MKYINIYRQETKLVGYSIDQDELLKHYLANEPRTQTPDESELLDYMRNELDFRDITFFKSISERGVVHDVVEEDCLHECKINFNQPTDVWGKE